MKKKINFIYNFVRMRKKNKKCIFGLNLFLPILIVLLYNMPLETLIIIGNAPQCEGCIYYYLTQYSFSII
jgi:hypothetical protein